MDRETGPIHGEITWASENLMELFKGYEKYVEENGEPEAAFYIRKLIECTKPASQDILPK